MAKGGYVGKILYVNLTDKSTEVIPTADYTEYGGGHGMGSALFFDKVKDKTVDGFHPDNLVTMMTSPLSGTLAPSASGRTECNFIGVYSYPKGWYTRSNFGGRFAGMLKYAGWDGIAIQGKSETPVWINIVNDKVTIEDASGLWGLNTYEAQEEIWSSVSGQADVSNWWSLGNARDGGRTTQRPAVAVIGQAGENLVRSAIVLHDAGNAAGQGGIGAVFGSKNLKAVSAIGTGSIDVADPKTLVDLRLELQDKFGYDVDAPSLESPVDNFPFYGAMTGAPGYGPLILPVDQPARPQGCMGCFKNCRRKLQSGVSNEDQCVESLYYMGGENQAIQNEATDLIDKYGLNVYDVEDHTYLLALYKMGVLGKGKAIDTDLPFDKYGSLEFIQAYTKAIALREGIGNDLAEGFPRAAEKWGRLEDLATGLLDHPNWGYKQHYDPRLEVEWSYGSILGDRDINEHGLNWHVYWMAYIRSMVGQEPIIPAKEVAELLAEHTGVGDPMGFNYSEEGIYSEAKAKTIAWHRHYTRFWKQSILYCDWAWPMLITYNNGADHTGATPEYEPKIFNAVTGMNLTYEEGLEIGRKIWNLDKAIWTLQGRHRDQEIHAGYVYDKPTDAPYSLPVYTDGEWSFSDNLGRTLDRDKWEGFKTTYFKLEGWSTDTGWPTRATLSKLGLDHVADELASKNKLGT